MPWSTPRTWVFGELENETTFNTHIRDNFNALLHPLSLSGTVVTVSNTVTETTIGSFTVPGNSMGQNGTLDVLYAGTLKRTRAANDTINIRVKWGGTTHFGTPITLASTENEMLFLLHVRIINLGSTSSQFLIAEWETPDFLGSTTTSLELWTLSNRKLLGHALPTIDTTADRTFDTSIQFNAASANLELKRYLLHAQAASV